MNKVFINSMLENINDGADFLKTNSYFFKLINRPVTQRCYVCRKNKLKLYRLRVIYTNPKARFKTRDDKANKKYMTTKGEIVTDVCSKVCSTALIFALTTK